MTSATGIQAERNPQRFVTVRFALFFRFLSPSTWFKALPLSLLNIAPELKQESMSRYVHEITRPELDGAG